MKDFEKFEDLTAKIYNLLGKQGYEVKRNVKLPGPDGDRQIDILIEGKLGPIDVRTIIECKDYKSLINVTKVDELHSKMQDVKAHVAILVARKGFTKGAVKKAKRLGIKLNTVHQAVTQKWNFDIDIPIVIEELTPDIRFSMNLTLDEGHSVRTDTVVINDIDIMEGFSNCWNVDLEPCPDKDWLSEMGVIAPYYVRDPKNGQIYSITDLSLKVEVVTKYFFGNLKELKNSFLLKEIIEKKNTVIFDVKELGNYKNIFSPHNSLAQLPNSLAREIRGIARPLLNGQSFSNNIIFQGKLVDKKSGQEEPLMIRNGVEIKSINS